jgi:hypothetical protein
MVKFTIITLFALLPYLGCFSQHLAYSEQVKAKMDQNKIDGLNTFSGIEFIHTIEIQKGLSDHIYKENPGLLNQNLESINTQFSFELHSVDSSNPELIKIEFIGSDAKNLDQLKQALTEKELFSKSLIITARLR